MDRVRSINGLSRIFFSHSPRSALPGRVMNFFSFITRVFFSSVSLFILGFLRSDLNPIRVQFWF